MPINFKERIKTRFKHPLFRNALFGSGGFVFISLIGLVITPFLVAYFGLEQYGIYILITSIFGYYGIFDFGLGQGLIKFVSEYRSQNLEQELNDAVNSVFTVQLFIGLLLSGFLILLAEKIVVLLNVSEIFFDDAVSALKIAAIGFFFSMLASTYASAIKGLELYGGVTVIDSGSNLVLNLLLLVVLMMNYGIKEAVWVNVFIAIVQLFSYSFLFKKNVKNYYFGFKFRFIIIKKFLSFTLYLFLSKVSNIFSTYVVRFVISFYLGPAAVTVYVVPAKLLGAIGGVTSSASNVIFPYISRLAAIGKMKEIKNSFIKLNLIATAVKLPILLLCVLFSKPIMTLWMGEEFAGKSWMILSIITLSATFGSFSTIPNLVLLGLGNSRLVGFFSGINIILYLIFLPLLTKNFGVIGAAIALLITSVIVIGLILAKTTKAIGLELTDFLNKVYKIHILPIIVLLFCVAFFKLFFNENYLIELTFAIVLGMSYYLYLFKEKALIF